MKVGPGSCAEKNERIRIKASFGMFVLVILSLAALSTSLVLHNMKILVVFVFCVVVIHSTPLLLTAFTHVARVPSQDSAIIRSDRLGGNFAYSTIEGHAYAVVTPILQSIAAPVTMADSIGAPMIFGNDSKFAYALESATLPKEHRGLPLNVRGMPLATRHSKG